MFSVTPIKTGKANVTSAEKQKKVENHKKTAAPLETAAKHHPEAAKHHEEDNHEKAAQIIIKAQGLLASET